MFGLVSESQPRSTRVVTLLCVAGLAVAGVALGYCIHLGAQRSDSDRASTQIQYVSPTEVAPNKAGLSAVEPSAEAVPDDLDTERSKVVLCTIDRIDAGSLSVHTADGRKHHLILSPDAHVQSTRGDSVDVLDVGDLVVVRVIKSNGETTADLIVDGRVSGSIPEN